MVLSRVVYGFFGLIVIVPLIQKVFDLPVGRTRAMMLLTEDAMRNCPVPCVKPVWHWEARNGKLVVIPSSVSAITSGVVLGIGTRHRRNDGGIDGDGNAGVYRISKHAHPSPLRLQRNWERHLPKGPVDYEAFIPSGSSIVLYQFADQFTVESLNQPGKDSVLQRKVK